MQKKIQEKITSKIKGKDDNPISASAPLDQKKLPIVVKVLAILCIVQCVFSSPIAFFYISNFIQQIASGEIADHSKNAIILYSIFLLGMLLTIVFLLILGIYLISNRRRHAAILMNTTAIIVAVSTICDLMLVGIQIETIILTVSVIVIITLKSYIDPSLAQERKLQNKLRDMEYRSDAEKGQLGLSKTGKGFAEINYFNLFWVFVIGCVIGYIFEIIWHMTVDNPGVYEERAGFLFGPFSPIYGIGGILMTACLNRLTDKNIIIVFVISALLGGFFEYFASLFLEMAFGIRSWDYSHLPLNIDGRVSIRFFFLWGIFGTCWVKILFKPLIKIINKIHWKWRYSITIVASILIMINAVMTLQALDCWYSRAAGKPVTTPIEQFYAKYFGDDFMHKRFENMKLNPKSAAREGNTYE